MEKSRFSILAIVILFILCVPVYATIVVGLREGDWIEYSVTYVGVPPDNYPEKVRIDIKRIQETEITVEIKGELLDGKSDSRSITFDLEFGAPDLIIIPANLIAGNDFYHNVLGNITIEGVEDYNFEGETRTLVYATFNGLDFRWDRSTGILIQAERIEDTFTQKYLAIGSSLGQALISEFDPLMLYAIIILAIIVIFVVSYFFLKRKRR
jgi:hypothetical protein